MTTMVLNSLLMAAALKVSVRASKMEKRIMIATKNVAVLAAAPRLRRDCGLRSAVDRLSVR
jgi:hypothetical protein